MPITKSAKKSLKVARTRQAQNYQTKIVLDKALKNANAKNVNQTVSTIDKAAKTGIIHKNKAARLKSALSKKYPTIKAAAKAIPAKPAIKAKAATKAMAKKEVAKKPAKKSK